jgi:vacuolar protein sorting-associated protein VTA1
VTRQTADTFDAAATFFDLLHAWGQPEAEVLQKIKFAKWNAARIMRAIREGKDPNESNPKIPEPEAEGEGERELAELQNELASPSTGAGAGAGADAGAGSSAPRPAQIEEVPDAGEPVRPVVSTSTEQPPPMPPSSHDGYFPSPTEGVPSTEPFVPSPLSHSPTGTAAAVSGPSTDTTSGLPINQSFSQPQPPSFTPSAPSPNNDPSAPPSWTTTPSVPHPASSNPPPVMSGFAAPQVFTPPPPSFVSAPAPQHLPTPQTQINPQPSAVDNATASYQDIAAAQKHAKWAISALNFEDVPTAISELRKALATLGAQ